MRIYNEKANVRELAINVNGNLIPIWVILMLVQLLFMAAIFINAQELSLANPSEYYNITKYIHESNHTVYIDNIDGNLVWRGN